MANPSVAVVILSWNGWPFLEQFLPSVLETTYTNARIIVADNASTDETVQKVREHFPEVEVISNPENHGFAHGYNEALKQVEADYYVLLNQDVEVTPDWVEPVIEAMEADPRVAIAQPKIKAQRQKTHFEYAGAAGGYLDRFAYTFCRGRMFDVCEEDTGQYDEQAEIFWASGAALFIRSEVYHKMGGLDADFFAHMEEIDLCWRVKEAGYRILAVPKSVVYHVGGGSLPQGNPLKTFLNFRNSLAMALKNWPKRTVWLRFSWRLLLDFVAAFQALTKWDWATIHAIRKAHWDIFLNPKKWFGKRKQAQALINANRIDPPNRNGLYRGWIVGAYFLRGKKKFSQLNKRKIIGFIN